MTWGWYTPGALTEEDPNAVMEPGKFYEARLELNRDLTVHEQAAAETSIVRDYEVYQNVDVKFIGFVKGSPQEVVVQFVPRATARAGQLAAFEPITISVIITALIAVLVGVAIVGAIIITGTVVYSVAVGVSRFLPLAVGLLILGGTSIVLWKMYKGKKILPKKITIPKIGFPKRKKGAPKAPTPKAVVERPTYTYGA